MLRKGQVNGLFFSGLSSDAFRNLDYQKVIETAKSAHLDGIEWEGDRHVPLGDTHNADIIRKATLAAGLKVLSFASYFKAGDSRDPSKDFLSVVDCAKTLNSPLIRIFAGSVPSKNCEPEYFKKVVNDIKTICNIAWRAGKIVCIKFHRGTLADSTEGILNLINAANSDNLKTYWSPSPALTREENQSELKVVLPYLENIRVSNWSEKGDRYELKGATDEWQSYIEIVNQSPKNKNFFLKFMMNDGLKQLNDDAETLNTWIKLNRK